MSPVTSSLQRAAEQLRAGQAAAAEPALRRHLQSYADDAHANRLMALCLLQQKKAVQAEFYARRAAAAGPDEPSNHDVLGSVLMMLHKGAEAERVYARGCELGPRIPSVHTGRGAALLQLEEFEAAHDCFERALALNPASEEIAGYLAFAKQRTYRMEEAWELLRRTVARHPRHTRLREQLAVLCNYVGAPADETLAHHRALGALITEEAQAQGAGPVKFGVTPEPGRALRVGLISPDFREHSVSRFVEGLVSNAGDSVRYVAFSATPREDATTARLRAHMPEWHDVRALSDAKLALLSRQEKIDIAIDLAGYTSGTRLAALAHRAAPVQVSAIGYPNTTGLALVGWRVGDAITDPAGGPKMTTELMLRVEPCFLCFEPPPEAPEVRPRDAGPIRFGSFNLLKKLSPATLALWGKVLAAVPGSKLVLKAHSMEKPGIRERVIAACGRAGMAPERVEILSYQPTISAHLGAYHGVDIALDTTPYNGTTTTCEAMWMGVPVVTLAGEVHAARVGHSLLRAAGQADLVAHTQDEFVEIARRLAADGPGLAARRAGLREALRGSVLCDAPAYARAFEVVLRHAWRGWCEGQRAPGGRA
ncbi:MAG: tetratricopeptide repeat protein [Tepidisphaera sp.]|nr:tetratricopeptide repeat protein [Tepidisphaera sp.]